MTLTIILVAALVFFITFVVWASKSIPRAIVFTVVLTVVFPFLLAIGYIALVAFSQNADSGRPQQVERAKRTASPNSAR